MRQSRCMRLGWLCLGPAALAVCGLMVCGLARAESLAPDDDTATAQPQAPVLQLRQFAVNVDGRLRVQFGTLTPERFLGIRMSSPPPGRDHPTAGKNDGFALGDARLNIRATFRDRLYVRLGFDGAIASETTTEAPVGELSTGLKDAYMSYRFGEALSLYAGRFKPPFDVEELTPTEDQFFVHRALESRGVLPHEGFSADTRGFAPGRQLGVMAGGERLFDGWLGSVGYALAVTNGNQGDASLNDNDLPAAWLRVQTAWRGDTDATDEEGPATYQATQGGVIGIGTFVNQISLGEATTRVDDRVVGVGIDAAMSVWLLRLQGQVLWSHTAHLSTDAAEDGIGGHAQVSLRIPRTGLAPGYRFALYNPRWVRAGGEFDAADYDTVMHHTVGLRYAPNAFPIVVLADYTHSVEQTARSIANDRFEAAAQVTFE